MELTAAFKKVPEGYIAWVEDLPGANTQGATLEEARANLREAIRLVFEANRELAKADSRYPRPRRHSAVRSTEPSRKIPFELQLLLRNHPDRLQPRLHQLGPSRDRKLRAPQPERMPALRIQMHLHGNASVLESDVVSHRLVYAVHVVILRLHQKS